MAKVVVFDGGDECNANNEAASDGSLRKSYFQALGMVTVMVVTIKMFFLLTEPFSGLVRIAVMQMAKQAVMQAGDNQSHNSSLSEPPGSSEGDG